MYLNKNKLTKLVSQYDESGEAFRTLYTDKSGNYYVEDKEGKLTALVEQLKPAHIELNSNQVNELKNLYLTEMVSPKVEEEANPISRLGDQVINRLS